MKLTKQEGRGIVYGDSYDWEEIESEMYETSRWSLRYSGVFHHKPTDKYYSTYWSVGATESQDESPFEYDNPDFTEVEKKEEKVMVTKWITVKKEGELE